MIHPFLLRKHQTVGCLFEPFEDKNNVKINHFEFFLPFLLFVMVLNLKTDGNKY
jgi:hypothetical protein